MKMLYLAPMVRGSFPPMRTISLKNQADVVYTDVIMARALIDAIKTVEGDNVYFNRPNQRVLMLKISESTQTVVELAGDNAKVLNQAAELLFDYSAGVDLNLGCARHFTTECKAGSVLGENPESLAAVIEGLDTKFTWSAKTRLFLTNVDTIEQLRLLLRKCDHIAVHARYFGDERGKDPIELDNFLSVMRQLTAEERTHIIYNGNIDSYDDYERFQDRCVSSGIGMMSVMIGRGALANTKIFQCIKERTRAPFAIDYIGYLDLLRLTQCTNDKFGDCKTLILLGLKHVRDHPHAHKKTKTSAIKCIETIAHLGTYEEIENFLVAEADNEGTTDD